VNPDQGFDDKILKRENTADKFFKNLFLIKIAFYLSLGLQKRRLSYSRTLRPSQENIQLQKKKFINFFLNLPACYGSYLGSNPDISQKNKMGDIRKVWPAHFSL
jgi:hypothetical protein